MGVQARLVLYAADSTRARDAAVAAFDRIAELDGIMSDYRGDSELMRLCERASTGPVPVSRDLFAVLSLAQRLSEQSDGAFDVTIGPLVRLWREARRSGRLPDPSRLEEARTRVGRHLMILDLTDRTVELLEPGMLLDLGGIAKGYAADAAVDAMRRHGIRSALVEFGGDVVAAGRPPGTDGWPVSAPLAPADSAAWTIVNEAISTSGDTQQFVEIAGVRYSHVVDPRSGVGLTSRAAATVIAPNGALSDALATTLSIMDSDAGRELLRRHYPEVIAFVRELSGD